MQQHVWHNYVQYASGTVHVECSACGDRTRTEQVYNLPRRKGFAIYLQEAKKKKNVEYEKQKRGKEERNSLPQL